MLTSFRKVHTQKASLVDPGLFDSSSDDLGVCLYVARYSTIERAHTHNKMEVLIYSNFKCNFQKSTLQNFHFVIKIFVKTGW